MLASGAAMMLRALASHHAQRLTGNMLSMPARGGRAGTCVADGAATGAALIGVATYRYNAMLGIDACCPRYYFSQS